MTFSCCFIINSYCSKSSSLHHISLYLNCWYSNLNYSFLNLWVSTLLIISCKSGHIISNPGNRKAWMIIYFCRARNRNRTMKKILDFKTVCECNRNLGCKTWHPQVSIINLENLNLKHPNKKRKDIVSFYSVNKFYGKRIKDSFVSTKKI